MKSGGGVSSYTLPAKRRWSWLVIAVLGLVLLSMFVPLAFLLGLHNGFHSVSGNSIEQRSSASDQSAISLYDKKGGGHARNQTEGGFSTRVDQLIRNFGPTLPKEFRRDSVKEAENKSIGFPVPKPISTPPPPKEHNTGVDSVAEVTEFNQGIDESEKMCELKFGSYCLWRQQHREKMKDSIVKKMKDQLYVARAYYPSIAKLPALDKLSHEMKQNIQEYERILSESSSDPDLPPQVEKKIQKMEATISKAKSVPVDCNNVEKKLRQLVDLTEDEANFHMKQSAFLYQLAVQTTPKSLHCLSMRLTVEYFKSSPLDTDQSQAENILNPQLFHYVIFSDNVLASSVVINSTVMHTRVSGKQVFHVLTDKQSFFSMKMWFFKNTYEDATVEVLNIEDFELDGQDKRMFAHLSMPEEFRVSFFGGAQSRTEYISVLSRLHYALPKIFPTLKKIVVLDDDIVVQRDLSVLWNLGMDGKVIGALQFCPVKLSELKSYLGKGDYDANSCIWMSGLNIIDLVQWRERDITKTYESLAEEQTLRKEESETEATTLRATLLTFQGLVLGLDDTWVLSGLGHNYGLDSETISKAAVLHYNGNMKPWLELGIPSYKVFWRKFLNRENQFLTDCNVNP